MSLTYSEVRATLDQVAASTSNRFLAFDAAFYAARYATELAGYAGDPLQHYVEIGAVRGLVPNRWFDESFYLQQYADLRVSGLTGADLLVHFARFGIDEGRLPAAWLSGFDAVRYLTENHDVAAYVDAHLADFGIDLPGATLAGARANGALAHFLKFGAAEGRQAIATTGTGVFTVTLDGGLEQARRGTLEAVDPSGAQPAAKVSFDQADSVRVLENNRNSSLDLGALSDAVAAAIGARPQSGDEGLFVAMTRTPSTTYAIDRDHDGAIAPGERRAATTVAGVENLKTGAANDTVDVDLSQADADNAFRLGGEQDNGVTFVRGADLIRYDHGAFAADLRPTLNLIAKGRASAEIAMNDGVLQARRFVDALDSVEKVDLGKAATSDRFDDRLDVSAIVEGATVNYGAAIAVGASLGGHAGTPTTIAQFDGDRLEAGGIAATGYGLGKALIEVAGLTLLERVTGAAGADRVILADSMQGAAIAVPARANLEADSFWTTSAWFASIGLPAAGVATSAQDFGLYRFDLGAGDDTLDYRRETQFLAVSVDTGATNRDLVLIGTGSLTGPGERVDFAAGVERYFGTAVAAANVIDLVRAGADVTVDFNRESAMNRPANEYAEPDGFDAVATDLVRGIEVRDTASGTVCARFMERTGRSDLGLPATHWDIVAGGDRGETVLLGDAQRGQALTLALGAGRNVVDYSSTTAAIVAELGPAQRGSAFLSQKSTVDAQTLWQAHDAQASSLTIVGSHMVGDTIGLQPLVLGAVVAAGRVENRSQVDPLFHVVDLAAGRLIEDPHGQYVDAGGALRGAGFVTFVGRFENASNAGDADAVHLAGDSAANALIGGGANDLIWGGRSTGDSGDRLTGGGGADRFVHTHENESPHGSVSGGQQSAAFFASDAAVARSRDVVTDFVPGTDRAVFVIDDSYDSVRVTGALPANLAVPLGAGVPAAFVGASNQFAVTIGKHAASAGTADDFDDYLIDTPAVNLGAADAAVRVLMSAAADRVDAALGRNSNPLSQSVAPNDAIRVELVYRSAGESTAAGFDEVLNFRAGEDKIDLSFLRVPRWATLDSKYDLDDDGRADALDAIRSLSAAPMFSINADMPGLFVDGAAHRAIAAQTTANAFGQASTLLFIDTQGDGNYTAGTDLVISLVGVGSVSIGDFLLDNYDTWAGGGPPY